MLSIFADLDGFTHYVDQRMGNLEQLRVAARTLFVLRAELTDVLQKDFNGRKVRLIGDCVQGIISEGTAQNVDAEETVTTGVLCAAAMHSSFETVQKMEPEANNLGLAIGLEYGATPVTRLGIRGDMSVRVATSQAVTNAEKLQESLDQGDLTAIGEEAYRLAPEHIQDIFDDARRKQYLNYPQLSMVIQEVGHPALHLAAVAAPALALSTGEDPRSYAGS
ncbi:MAG: hypothetical protein COB59_07810 [Rhodospirillaceae bacterium]|nr:MAG: hypothetical protein COB59_07810 [Rhodospirillaceae bacterium]